MSPIYCFLGIQAGTKLTEVHVCEQFEQIVEWLRVEPATSQRLLFKKVLSFHCLIRELFFIFNGSSITTIYLRHLWSLAKILRIDRFWSQPVDKKADQYTISE